MDNKFTELIKQWLETPSDQRDYSVGALYLLKLSGNQIMYRNLVAYPKGKAEFIDYQLQKYYNFRVQSLTHAQVEEMQEQVNKIVEINNLADRLEIKGECLESNASPHSALHTPLAKGKRDDHDSLPDEIKAKYVENLSILQRMRELHLKLRSLSLDTSPCPDSERYPFLKELIELDKKMHANWEEYDHYVVSEERSVESGEEKRSAQSAKKSAKKASPHSALKQKLSNL